MAVQQGGADGLCGLYALLNWLRTTPVYEDEDHERILWYLLEAARQHGWLDPHTLTCGFEDFQLKAIVDWQIENHRLPFQSAFLRDVKVSMGVTSVAEFLRRLVAAGGVAVVSSQRRNHWLLVRTNSDGPSIYDSANPDQPVKPLPTNSRSFSPDWGIVILPHKRPPVKVEL